MKQLAREATVGLKTTTVGGDVELVTALEAFPVGKDVFALTDYGSPKWVFFFTAPALFQTLSEYRTTWRVGLRNKRRSLSLL